MAHGESINLSLCGKDITLLQENEKKERGYWSYVCDIVVCYVWVLKC
jgi:hypothetical protein